MKHLLVEHYESRWLYPRRHPEVKASEGLFHDA